MSRRISASVGKGGENNPDDVKIVQTLLNSFAKDGNLTKLKVDSKCGNKTESAIATFQKNLLGVRPDSKIDPRNITFSALNAGPKALHHYSKLQKPAGEKAKPRVIGKTLGVNKKILNLLNEVSAHYDTPIKVTSGLRTPQQQAQVM
ncbi:MAG: peptidoglycan-binding protein [Pseudomonadota bacterium]